MKKIKKIPFFIFFYFLALVLANITVKELGHKGILIASFFLIPFDFICRCIFHETWKGLKLVKNLILITIVSSLVTILLNKEAFSIALASVLSIISVQIFAGVVYQYLKKKSYFLKVNLSDLCAVVVDSFVFQLVAFSFFDYKITLFQILIKFLGGIMWYFIIFKFLKFKP